MKKILATIFFSFIWCETSNAENQQICDWIVDEVYADLLNQGSNDHLFVVVGNDGKCEYGRGTEKQDGFNDCEKHRKEKGINGECKLFAIGKKKFLENKTALKTGCIKGNCINGKGTFKWPNGDRYEGDWVNGQRTGQGKYFYSSGGGVYTGEWKNNNRHGEGTMIWNDGVKQVAIWEMDKPVKTISLSKNFIFKGGSEWKDGDIINKKDPSNFINLSFLEKKNVMGYDVRTLSNKYTKDGWGKSSFTVFVFNASFENSKDILINVNDEFKTNKKAKKQAIKWAKIYGQMPKFLKKNVKEITIHKGKTGWAGGKGTIVIHTDYLTNENKKYAEELMFHELTHASLDWWWGGSVNEKKWLNAVSADKHYISEYAWELPGNEDLAETVLWWYASRCKVDRISKKNNEKVNKFLTNRFQYLDEQNYDTNPSSCIN